jgi:putative hydrolase of the HAD superfamily
MSEITTLFGDVGGVILTNGWDWDNRRQAAEHFNLDGEEMQERHERVLADFETGRLSLAEYLGRTTVFYQAHSFTLSEFEAFMFAQSQPHPEAIEVVEALAGQRKYLLGTINNESLELNLYRIERFDLRRYFTVFFSPCFVEVRKPDEATYRLALRVTQRRPAPVYL